MGHDHHHHHGGDHRAATAGSAKVLSGLAIFTAVFMVVEIIGGLISGSLALLADSGHMFMDTSALFIAAFAARMAQRPVDKRNTFGYRRAEVLGAFLNAVLLYGLVVYIAVESIHRLIEPQVVMGGLMAIIAAIGLVINLIALVFILRARRESKDMNLRAALIHVMTDSLGSIGALVAAGVIYWTGWYYADAIAGLLVASLVGVYAARLFRDAAYILLQRVPLHLDVQEIGERIAAVPGVKSIHDIHVWAHAEGDENLTAHVVVENAETLKQWDELLVQISEVLRDEFDIDHATIQPELDPDQHQYEIEHLGSITSTSAH